ncbi:glycerol-3-phosphate 1-O-acyltransferase PlsY [Facilibium subflavum]|uniref:glycerol-3-phosphate 1-O-acyltransferase PlsY n=1 Tax=Facilibium subflavum TaxID=2219058 RepID=UPI000E6548D2|nr:glycerol-3-phosphate 1-O-acyltransferase PlsY [Facilibium subflavum]
MLTFVLLLIIAYLFGSINCAILTCFVLRLPSPRTIGSGNPGATNVLRLGGKKAAIITLLGDALKGFIPVLGAHFFGLTEIQIATVALFAILGHIFPVFFGFKGGKGVATLIGVLFGYNWLIGAIFVISWLVLAFLTRYSSLSALIATIITTLCTIIFYGVYSAAPFIIIAILVIIRHQENIKRLLSGTESKIGQKKSSLP